MVIRCCDMLRCSFIWGAGLPPPKAGGFLWGGQEEREKPWLWPVKNCAPPRCRRANGTWKAWKQVGGSKSSVDGLDVSSPGSLGTFS